MAAFKTITQINSVQSLVWHRGDCLRLPCLYVVNKSFPSSPQTHGGAAELSARARTHVCSRVIPLYQTETNSIEVHHIRNMIHGNDEEHFSWSRTCALFTPLVAVLSDLKKFFWKYLFNFHVLFQKIKSDLSDVFKLRLQQWCSQNTFIPFCSVNIIVIP